MPDLPPPLPPNERTVGQLIGETIRTYGERFWPALPLGLPLAVIDQVSVHRSLLVQIVVFLAAAPLMAAAYVWACVLVHRVRPTGSAFVLAVAIYLPFPLLRALYTLPGVAWLALVGMAVPAALVEGTGLRRSLRRGLELARADYVHALGSLAALVIVVGVGEITLTALLHSMGDASQRVALALADVVLSPLLFLGGAMLYLDQVARERTDRSGGEAAGRGVASAGRG